MTSSSIQIYDSLRAKKLAFEPRDKTQVQIYCCGPTVYGFTHVGNARAALNLDLVVRCLQHFGYGTKVARNYTDIDDKIIRVAEAESKDFLEVSRFFEEAYASELKELGNLSPDFSPRATEHMEQMLQMIQGLIAKGKAYPLKTSHGTDVYFHVQSFPAYGKLSHRKLEDLIEGTRAETEEGKKHPGDFALWKAAKEGEPFWESPWGRGRPGWHIECSAMIAELFPNGLDIHMGGLDLIFPHHENEIAQSEALSDQALARYWVHNGMLEIDSEKMSKSIGNIMTTRRFLDFYGAECLRLLIYSSHYRSPIDFSAKSIHAAEAGIMRLYQARELALQYSKASPAPALASLAADIEAALKDDFNSAKALGFALGAARTCYKENKPEYWSAWQVVADLLSKTMGLFQSDFVSFKKGLEDRKIKRSGLTADQVKEIESLLEQRQNLRAEKKYQEADQIRTQLEAQSILIMDSAEGTGWTTKENL